MTAEQAGIFTKSEIVWGQQKVLDTCAMLSEKMRFLRFSWACLAGIIMGVMTYLLLEKLVIWITSWYSNTQSDLFSSVPVFLHDLPKPSAVAIVLAQGVSFLLCAAIATFSSRTSNRVFAIISVLCLMALSTDGVLNDRTTLLLYFAGLLLAWPATVWGHKFGVYLQRFDRL